MELSCLKGLTARWSDPNAIVFDIAACCFFKISRTSHARIGLTGSLPQVLRSMERKPYPGGAGLFVRPFKFARYKPKHGSGNDSTAGALDFMKETDQRANHKGQQADHIHSGLKIPDVCHSPQKNRGKSITRHDRKGHDGAGINTSFVGLA